MEGAIDDRVVEGEFAVGAYLPVDHVCGFRDDHRGRDKWPVVGFQQGAAGLVVVVVSVRRRDEDTGINDEHV